VFLFLVFAIVCAKIKIAAKNNTRKTTYQQRRQVMQRRSSDVSLQAYCWKC